MHLNTLKVAKGRTHKKKRLGRGIGSGKGKTCGRGMKGQLARSGGKVKPGFEGGQMPIQRRLPKFGFTSRKGLYRAEIRLFELNKLDETVVTLEVLRKAGLISGRIKYVKVITKGDISKSLTLKGIKVTASSRRLIEAQGGTIIDD